MSSESQVAPKKPYQRPSLRIYGNIEALTATVGTGAMSDGAGAPVKTH